MTTLVPEVAAYPVAPAAEPLDGTLLSIVTPQTGGSNLADSVGLFQSFNCLDTGHVAGVTCGPVASSKFTDSEGPEWIDGYTFAAYGTVVCKLVDPDVLKDGIDKAYTAAESRIIEAALMEESFQDATDLTPGSGAVSPIMGVGLLESHMSRSYAGKGIIHVPRLAGSLLAQQGVLSMDDNGKLSTNLGTPAAAGGGYDLPNLGPDGDEAAAGSKWLYATGQILILRNRLTTEEVFNIYGVTGTTAGLSPNDTVALAEGVYIVAVDCYKAAVRVTVS